MRMYMTNEIDLMCWGVNCCDLVSQIALKMLKYKPCRCMAGIWEHALSRGIGVTLFPETGIHASRSPPLCVLSCHRSFQKEAEASKEPGYSSGLHMCRSKQ